MSREMQFVTKKIRIYYNKTRFKDITLKKKFTYLYKTLRQGDQARNWIIKRLNHSGLKKVLKILILNSIYQKR